MMAIALANGGVSFLNPYCTMLNGFLYFLSLITIFLKNISGAGSRLAGLRRDYLPAYNKFNN